jgi:hypothetical protein
VYVSDAVGDLTVDSLPALGNYPAGFDFMTHDDNRCMLRGGCPRPGYFDVIEPSRAAHGIETAVEYVRSDMTQLPAGVAFTDTSGYQTVTLGFGMEFMSDGPLPDGHYAPGISDRVDLMANIMEYFGRVPSGPPTGADASAEFVNRLGHARPNPFRPATTIDFSLAADGRAIVRVYDAAGRVVRTLVDSALKAGPHAVVWDGFTDDGTRAASGVYFVRMESGNAGGSASKMRKLVLLK